MATVATGPGAGPTLRQRADRHIGRPVSVNSGQARCWLMMGSKFIEEAGWRQTAPASCHSGFMPGAAAAAAQILRTGGAGEQGGYPVAKTPPTRRLPGDARYLPG